MFDEKYNFKDIFTLFSFFKELVSEYKNEQIYFSAVNQKLVNNKFSDVSAEFYTSSQAIKFKVHNDIVNQFQQIFNDDKENLNIYYCTSSMFSFTKNNLDKIDRLISLKSFI